eukprot:604424-Prorocentrum_minimum.AAC.1
MFGKSYEPSACSPRRRRLKHVQQSFRVHFSERDGGGALKPPPLYPPPGPGVSSVPGFDSGSGLSEGFVLIGCSLIWVLGLAQGSRRVWRPGSTGRGCEAFVSIVIGDTFYKGLKGRVSGEGERHPGRYIGRGDVRACTWRCRPTSCITVSMATLVLPAPVGAHTSMLSGANSAVWYTRLCERVTPHTHTHTHMSPHEHTHTHTHKTARTSRRKAPLCSHRGLPNAPARVTKLARGFPRLPLPYINSNSHPVRRTH